MECDKIATCEKEVSEHYFKNTCLANSEACIENFKKPREWKSKKNEEK